MYRMYPVCIQYVSMYRVGSMPAAAHHRAHLNAQGPEPRAARSKGECVGGRARSGMGSRDGRLVLARLLLPYLGPCASSVLRQARVVAIFKLS